MCICRKRLNAGWNWQQLTVSECGNQSLQSFRILRLTLPNDDAPPAKFAKRTLMKFVAHGVAVEFGQPPFAAIRRRRAVLAAFVPMPEAAVDEDGGFVFRKEDIH